MIRSLATGKLRAKPEVKTGKAGKTFVLATMTADASAGSVWVNVIAFGEIADQLAALSARSVISVCGRSELSAWRDQKTGVACAGMRIVADDLIVLDQPRPRQKLPGSKPPSKARILRAFNEMCGEKKGAPLREHPKPPC